MKALRIVHITKISIPGPATLVGLIGFVGGGFLYGIIILASFLQGYLAGGDSTFIQTGFGGLVLMIVYGVIGGSLHSYTTGCLGTSRNPDWSDYECPFRQ